MITEELKLNWNRLVKVMSNRFADGESLDIDSILFIIGMQEVGLGYKRYKKDEKIDLIHVAIATLLQPYGYYEYVGKDHQGWPHFNKTSLLPNLKPGEQALLMKEAAINYALENGWI